ncbi:hypothetical protein AHAS_AhasUnG0032900 [Arachis hypogaea]
MKVRRALVDAGLGINIISTHMFLEMGGSSDKAYSKVGSIKTNNKFYVVDRNSSCHILLGHPWIHLYRCIPLSWHQCIKSSWKENDISIPATVTTFDTGEAHLVDASFYKELVLPWVNKIRLMRECPIRTPRQKGAQKNALMVEAPKENTKKQAPTIEGLGLRKKNYQNSPSPDILSVQEKEYLQSNIGNAPLKL